MERPERSDTTKSQFRLAVPCVSHSPHWGCCRPRPVMPKPLLPTQPGLLSPVRARGQWRWVLVPPAGNAHALPSLAWPGLGQSLPPLPPLLPPPAAQEDPPGLLLTLACSGRPVTPEQLPVSLFFPSRHNHFWNSLFMCLLACDSSSPHPAPSKSPHIPDLRCVSHSPGWGGGGGRTGVGSGKRDPKARLLHWFSFRS